MNIFINIGLHYKHFFNLSSTYGDLSIESQKLKEHTKEILTYCKKYDIKNVFIKDSLHTRKERRALYNTLRQFSTIMNCGIIALLERKPLSYTFNQNHFMNEEEVILKLQNKLRSFQPPREGVDCDKIIISTSDFDINIFDHYTHLYRNIHLDHSVPSHKETIVEHIEMVSKASESLDDSNLLKKDLIRISEFHDLGKLFNKRWNVDRNKIHYPDHAGISSYLFLTTYTGVSLISKQDIFLDILGEKNKLKLCSFYELSESEKRILECIYRHMVRYSPEGISKKFIRRNKLNKLEIDLLEKFSELDAENRIREDDIE